MREPTLQPSDLPPLIDAALAAGLCRACSVPLRHWPRTLGALRAGRRRYLAVRVSDERGSPAHWLLWCDATPGCSWLTFRELHPLQLRRSLATWLLYRRADEVASSALARRVEP